MHGAGCLRGYGDSRYVNLGRHSSFHLVKSVGKHLIVNTRWWRPEAKLSRIQDRLRSCNIKAGSRCQSEDTLHRSIKLPVLVDLFFKVVKKKKNDDSSDKVSSSTS